MSRKKHSQSQPALPNQRSKETKVKQLELATVILGLWGTEKQDERLHKGTCLEERRERQNIQKTKAE
ncbi:MAG: hypothetical protein CM15mP49_26300 [Actinomycetota bacterium]|nr:MAG: hypothetical protein CM15mP49_26300 [Actinomycetota bacterium]